MQKIAYKYSKLSVAQFQDKQRIGWNRTRKLIFLTGLVGVSAELIANYYKTDIHYTFVQNKHNIDILQNCPSLRLGVFKPTVYLQNAFLQSLYGSKIDPVPYIPMTRQEIPVDGGIITIDALPVPQKYLRTDGSQQSNMRVLVVLHGLTGGSECNYIRHTALYASRKGFKTYCINMRGYGNSRMLSAKPTDFTTIDDLEAGMNYIKENNPNSKLYCLGFSMGSSQMIRYMAKHHEIQGGVAISTPWNISELVSELNRPLKRIYDLAITKNFQRNLKFNMEAYQNSPVAKDIEKALKCTRIQDFDDVITRKLLNYNSVEELYAKIECLTAIDDLKAPTLFISSGDDPVIKKDFIPKEKFLKNENLILALTQKGGHVEWFTGFKATRWIKKPAIEFLDYIDKRGVQQ